MPKQSATIATEEQIDLLTRRAIEMILLSQKAVENLAVERARHKLSAHRAAAVARELKQLGIVLGGYEYQHSADRS